MTTSVKGRGELWCLEDYRTQDGQFARVVDFSWSSERISVSYFLLSCISCLMKLFSNAVRQFEPGVSGLGNGFSD